MVSNPRARTEGIISQRVDDELIILDSVTNAAHCLSAQAAEVWRLCDGESSLQQIAAKSGLASGRTAEVLQTLREADLLEHYGQGESGQLSRRDAAKRFAQLGAAAVGAQLIFSIGLPAAAAAASATACVKDSDCAYTDLCVTGSRCNQGVCEWTFRNCDDNNACTVDSCDPVNGICTNRVIDCDDGNPCTIDTCDGFIGCINTPVQDGTSCGSGSVCQSGVCVAT